MASGVLPSPVGKRVAFVGDTHANVVWTCRVVEELAADGVDMVVQFGDFGWWPRSDFAQKVSQAAVIAGVTVCFIDGKHEDHEHLEFHANLRSPERGRVDPVEMLPSLWYLPRGCGWEWQGVRFRALGGAFSVDHMARTPGYDWFPVEEVPSASDAERAISEGPADVLLCHDHPSLGYRLKGLPIPEAEERTSAQVRRLLAQVVEAIHPKLVVHGHWHHAYEVERNGITIKGLDCDGTDQAVALLDLDTLEVEDWGLPDPARCR